MQKFIIPWAIIGETVIKAESQEAAETEFNSMSVRTLADDGELVCHPTETEDERTAFAAKTMAAVDAKMASAKGH